MAGGEEIAVEGGGYETRVTLNFRLNDESLFNNPTPGLTSIS